MMRFDAADREWRLAFAFAFGSALNAILVVAGDKSGGSVRPFDRRLARLAKEGES